MKRSISFVCVVLMVLVSLIGCGKTTPVAEQSEIVVAETSEPMRAQQDADEQVQVTAEPLVEEATPEPTPEPLKLLDVRPFSDGVAWAYVESGWICIDKQGKTVLTLKKGEFPKTGFSNGVAIIMSADEGQPLEMIDKTGTVVSSPNKGEYTKIAVLDGPNSYQVEPNKDGIAFVFKDIDTYDKSERQYGAINSKGEIIVQPGEWGAGRIGSIAKLEYYGEGIMGFFENGNFEMYNSNTKKKITVNNVDSAKMHFDFKNGMAVFAGRDGVFSMNSDFELTRIIAAEWPEVGHFADGLFFYDNGFYNIKGEKVIDLKEYKFDNLWAWHVYPYFTDGYCLLKLVNGEGRRFITVIDTKGNKMFEPLSLGDGHVTNLSCGLMKIVFGRSSFVDLKGETVIQDISGECTDFSDDVAMVRTTQNECYYIDKTGKRLF